MKQKSKKVGHWKILQCQPEQEKIPESYLEESKIRFKKEIENRPVCRVWWGGRSVDSMSSDNCQNRNDTDRWGAFR